MSKFRTRGIVLLLLTCGAAPVIVLLVFRWYSLSQVREQELIGPIHAVAYFPDGQHIATANQDGTVRVWDLSDGHETVRLGKQYPAVVAIDVARSGDRVAASWNNWMDREYGWILWSVDDARQLKRALGHSQTVNDVAFTPDGRRVLTASGDRTVRVWDAETAAELFRFGEHEGCVNAIAISPDGLHALSAAGDYTGGVLHDPTVRLWDLESGKLVGILAGHTGQVTDVAFAPDGIHAASCGWDGEVRVWELETGNDVRRFEVQNPVERYLSCLAYSPDGHFIVAGSGTFATGSLHVWAAATGEEVRTFSGSFSAVHSIAFSPDGNRIVSAHGYHGLRPDGAKDFFGESLGTTLDGMVRVWDINDGRELMDVGDLQVKTSR